MSFYHDIFVVRFWDESRGSSGEAREMRGVVEHVRTGEKRYVNHPDQVCQFIGGYVDGKHPDDQLEGMNRWGKIRRWINVRRGGLRQKSGGTGPMASGKNPSCEEARSR